MPRPAIRAILLLTATLLAGFSSAMADTRFVTWNIANFWHVPGEYLRPERDGSPGLIRIPSDYDAIRNVIGQLGGDVFALQEMGSPEGVRAIFPEADWGMIFAKSFAEDIVKNPAMLADPTQRDIYPVLVYRRTTIKLLAEDRISGLRLPDVGDDGVVRYTREGVAAKLSVKGRELWVAVVHLKSGCAVSNPFDAKGTTGACGILAAQIPVLKEWLDARLRERSDVIILGDFNHQLAREGSAVLARLNENIADGMALTPSTEKSLCSAFRDDEQPSIDFIMVSPGLRRASRLNNSTPKLNILSEKMSDHCPVWLDINLRPS